MFDIDKNKKDRDIQLLIVPSSLSLTPYVYNYLKIFLKHNIKTDMVIWDRLQNYDISQTEEYEQIIDNVYVFDTGKKSIRKGFFDYVKFSHIVGKKYDFTKYSQIVIFSPQLYFFVFPYLRKQQIKVVVDIRDYHRTIPICNKLNLWRYVDKIVLSSPFFQEFIRSENFVINHNTNIRKKDLKENPIKNDISFSTPITIGSVGAFRDFEINKKLINKIGNHKEIILTYDGEGIHTSKLKDFVSENQFHNVEIQGYFEQKELDKIYRKIDISNLIRDSDNIINKNALPNRMYDSVQFGKPLLCNSGNAVAKMIEKYELGLIIEDIDEIKTDLCSYCRNFSASEFAKKRILFLTKVMEDNEIFEDEIVNRKG